MAAWGVSTFLERWQGRREASWATLAALVLVAFVICTRIQLGVLLAEQCDAVQPGGCRIARQHHGRVQSCRGARAGGDQRNRRQPITSRRSGYIPTGWKRATTRRPRRGFNLGAIYAGQGRWPEAEAQFREKPSCAGSRTTLGRTRRWGSVLLAEEPRHGEASEECRTVCEIGARQRESLAGAWDGVVRAGPRRRAALKAYREAVRLSPDSAAALNDLAWLLATLPDAKLRDGAEALRLAQRACDLTQNQEPLCLATLDAAYAETGQFPKAIQAAQETKNVALASRRADLAADADERLDLSVATASLITASEREMGAGGLGAARSRQGGTQLCQQCHPPNESEVPPLQIEINGDRNWPAPV